jgi:hypothetical protein
MTVSLSRYGGANMKGQHPQDLRDAISDLMHEFGAEEVLATAKQVAEEAPQGGIRFTDACEKFNIRPALLSDWIRKGQVRVLKRPSRKLVFVSLDDLKERVERMELYKHAMKK